MFSAKTMFPPKTMLLAKTILFTKNSVYQKTFFLQEPCFHPKQSYILLEDSSLIVIGGSNNITQSAWWSNIECVNVFHFTPHANENIRYFP